MSTERVHQSSPGADPALVGEHRERWPRLCRLIVLPSGHGLDSVKGRVVVPNRLAATSHTDWKRLSTSFSLGVYTFESVSTRARCGTQLTV